MRECTKGLYQKYRVTKDGEAVTNCFVLEPESDEAARAAIRAYVDETDDEELAADLSEWMASLEGGR